MHVELQVLFGVQNGLAGSVQSAPERHSTHLLFSPLVQETPRQHAGFPEAAVQRVASVALHSRHDPPTQAGKVVVGQAEDAFGSPKLPLQGLQTFPAQTGAVGFVHCVPDVQFTHTGSATAVLQKVAPPVHLVQLPPGPGSGDGFTSPLHSAHAPAIGPVVKHAGLSAPQANVAPDPNSPLHPTHVFVAKLHDPVVPVHAVEFVAEH